MDFDLLPPSEQRASAFILASIKYITASRSSDLIWRAHNGVPGANTHTYTKTEELVHYSATHGNLLHIGERLRNAIWKTKLNGEEAPLRSQLFSKEQMKQHGKSLAAVHVIARNGHRTSFWRDWLTMKRY